MRISIKWSDGWLYHTWKCYRD